MTWARHDSRRVACWLTELAHAIFWGLCIPSLVLATPRHEQVAFVQEGTEHVVQGKVLVEAEDGGLLLEGRNQTIWAIQPDDIVNREQLTEPPEPLTKSELAKVVLGELPAGFRVHQTNHYVICYNTSKSYAEWCGALFERLHRAFNNYWSRRRIPLRKTPPLVACVFRDKKSYRAYGRGELGDTIESILGYYSYQTNRIAMYDLLGGRRARSFAQLNALLRRERTVATIVHEATHQLAFNAGLHQRFADIPLWLSEGLAIYFETPDLSSTRGWTTIGSVNSVRLNQFKQFAPRRTKDSLTSLTSTDDRFQKARTATDAYAESWAFCFYLIRTHPEEFADYLKLLQTKAPLDNHDPQRRLDDFATAFGKPPAQLNRDFLRHLKRVK